MTLNITVKLVNIGELLPDKVILYKIRIYIQWWTSTTTTTNNNNNNYINNNSKNGVPKAQIPPSLSLSLSLSPNTSLSAIAWDKSSRRHSEFHRADTCKFLLVDQHWRVHVPVLVKEHLWVASIAEFDMSYLDGQWAGR